MAVNERGKLPAPAPPLLPPRWTDPDPKLFGYDAKFVPLKYSNTAERPASRGSHRIWITGESQSPQSLRNHYPEVDAIASRWGN